MMDSGWDFLFSGATVKQQCVLYITKDKDKLLVFEQPDPRWSQTQVIKGALEVGETPLQAATRILQSETGLILEFPCLLESQIWTFSWEGETNTELVHYVWFQATPETPEAWTTNGSSNEFDQPRTYKHQFVPLENIKLEWEMAVGLPKLLEAINPITEVTRQEINVWHGETQLESCAYPISRDRVVCYITRNRKEILVFEHETRYSDAGVQVVAGGMETGETVERAALREVLEESGLALSNPIPLSNAVMHRFMDKIGDDYHRWHFVWLEANDAPDAWQHTISGGEEDTGMIFFQRFAPLEHSGLHWKMDVMIPRLLELLKCRDVAVNYITRNNEILMLEGHPWGGIQVVAGGVDAGETPAQAAVREALEEAGLRLEHPKLLGTQEWHGKSGDTVFHEFRHYHQFSVTEPRDSWEHVVSAGEVDAGFVFKHQFVKLEEAHLDYELDVFLGDLKGDD
jgi:8-oxo-dGTP pyrophosphatase MutT (NUDIX family)